MKARTVFVILLLPILAGCSGKNSGTPKLAANLKITDSTGTAAPLPERILTYEERQGKVRYEQYCAVCHGKEGKGDGFNAFNLDPRPRDFSDSVYMNALGDKQALQTISGGGRSVNKSPLMPSYGWTLKKEEIQYVVLYLRTFSTHE